MTHELFYTSVQRGLAPGSQGFCTVAATTGLPSYLQDRLEALSAYRPSYAFNDPQAARNPISFAHTQFDAGGKKWHVLSRVGPAPLDYSDRTNKFAHFVVLDAVDLPLAGPAWALAQPGFMESSWDGEIGWIENGREVPQGNQGAAPCAAWEEMAGDAGWAGVLVQKALEDSEAVVYVVFKPGMDLLPLFVEAIALVPMERRNEICFNTYAVSVPKGAKYQWRGILLGSPEAKALSASATVVDLTSPGPVDEESEWTDRARTGRVPAAPERPEASSTYAVRNPGQARSKSVAGSRSAGKPERSRSPERSRPNPTPPAAPERRVQEPKTLGFDSRWFSGFLAGTATGAGVVFVFVIGILLIRGFATGRSTGDKNGDRADADPPKAGVSAAAAQGRGSAIQPNVGAIDTKKGSGQVDQKPTVGAADPGSTGGRGGAVTQAPNLQAASLAPGAVAGQTNSSSGTLVGSNQPSTSPVKPKAADPNSTGPEKPPDAKNNSGGDPKAKGSEFLLGLDLPLSGSAEYPLSELEIDAVPNMKLDLIGPKDFKTGNDPSTLKVESKNQWLEVYYTDPASGERRFIAEMSIALKKLQFLWKSRTPEELKLVAPLLRDSVLAIYQPKGDKIIPSYVALRKPVILKDKEIHDDAPNPFEKPFPHWKYSISLGDMDTRGQLRIHAATVFWNDRKFTSTSDSFPGSASLRSERTVDKFTLTVPKNNKSAKVLLDLEPSSKPNDKDKAPRIDAICLYIEIAIPDHPKQKIAVCRFGEETKPSNK